MPTRARHARKRAACESALNEMHGTVFPAWSLAWWLLWVVCAAPDALLGSNMLLTVVAGALVAYVAAIAGTAAGEWVSSRWGARPRAKQVRRPEKEAADRRRRRQAGAAAEATQGEAQVSANEARAEAEAAKYNATKAKALAAAEKATAAAKAHNAAAAGRAARAAAAGKRTNEARAEAEAAKYNATKAKALAAAEKATATTSTNIIGGAKTLPVGKTKSPKAIERIFAAIKQNTIFSRLSDAQLTMLQQAMQEHHVKAGCNVIKQGEKGNHFYVVDSGELDAFVKPAGASEQQFIKPFHAGDMFGELALMYNCPRTATIQARTDVTLWSLDRVSFRLIVLEANTKKASQFESYLEKVQLLEPLTKDQRNRMVDALEEVAYAPEQSIIVEGEAGTHFYIIVEGEVKITKAGQAAELARRSKGDYFGELSLKTGSPTIASVTAASACKLVRMDRGAFQRLLGPAAKARDAIAAGRAVRAATAGKAGEVAKAAVALKAAAKVETKAAAEKAATEAAKAAAATEVLERLPSLPVMSLAAAHFDTGRRVVPESTIGGQTTCIVCFVNLKSHAAVPCGHQCACGDCARQMRECPVCRTPAREWMQVRVA